MYKIKEFSILAKTTVKTLRYYEATKLLIPAYIDSKTNYRYYDSKQLLDLSKIIFLRQIGLSIKQIYDVLHGSDIKEVLAKRKEQVIENINNSKYELSKINYLMEEKKMKYEIVEKELPEYTVYYKEGVIKSINDITEFILSSAAECRTINPNIECIIPDYCYVSYLDKEFKDTNIKVRYAQAVKAKGIENESIKFEKLLSHKAICVLHKGSYEGLANAYSFIMKYTEDNGYDIIESPRERYIDGIWNKEDEGEWLTEIQVPVKKK